jgi:hypothetical protein
MEAVSGAEATRVRAGVRRLVINTQSGVASLGHGLGHARFCF